MVLEQVDLSIRTKEVQPSLPPCASRAVKWIVDSNIKTRAVKLLEEHLYNMGQARLLGKDTEGNSVKRKRNC